MSRIPANTIDAIYNAVDIVEVVGDYVTLKKKGQNFWALSPFTNEKTPSFAVNPAKGIFKCFSSGKGGNAVGFLMEMEGYTYVEALKHLAKKYGIEIEEKEESPEEKQARDNRESLFIVNEYAARYFNEQLLQTDSGKAIGLSYFKERGILDTSIEQFQLGYSQESWDALVKDANSKQYQDDFLIQLGLASRSEKTGNLIDRFRGRVMFPIHNVSGKVVGFGGRTLSSSKEVAKYINSPESEIYHKSRVLYGLYQAKKHIRDEDLCILTEGYMDTISLAQHGIKNVVASSGTALTPDQVKLIRRFTQNVLMIYDGDAAGIKAASRGIDILLKEGMQAKVLILPDGNDPDSYVQEKGKNGFLAFIEEAAQSFIEFKIGNLRAGKDLADPQVQTDVIKGVSETLANIPDLVQRQMYIRYSAEQLSISETLLSHAVDGAMGELVKQVEREKRRKAARQETAEVKDLESFKQIPMSSQEKELLRVMLNHHDKVVEEEVEALETEEGETVEPEQTPLIEYFLIELEDMQFENQIYEQIKQEIFEEYEETGGLKLNRYLDHANQDVQKIVADLMMLPEISPNWRKHGAFVLDLDANISSAVKGPIYHYKYKRIEKMIAENRERLKEMQAQQNEHELDKLLGIYMYLKDLQKQIGDKIGAAGAVSGLDGRL